LYLRRVPLYFWLSFFASIIFFWLFSSVDIWFSSLFFDGKEFFLRSHPLIRALYEYTQVFTVIVGVFLLVLLLLSYTKNKTTLFPKKAVIFLFLSLIIGPGLLVNATLKDNFGRARPAQIKEFGGSKEFTKAFEISANCQKNCSFACGHASAAFWFLSFGFVVGEAYRRRVFIGGVAFGTAVGFARIAQGGHFLSDVIFAGLLVYLVSKILYEVILVGRASER